jgi:hypothetical protein
MGLILTVEPGITFAHRSLQEHLASRALLRRDDEVQRRIVGERASAANWDAVILGLLGMIGDGNRLDGLVKQIESAPSLQERWSRSGLLAEAAVGTRALSKKTRERLLRMVQIEVERGLHDGVRRDVVDALCEGIGRRELRPIAHRIQHWLPRHFDWGAIHGLVEWATEDEEVRSLIADVLFQTLASDDPRAARVAAGGLRALSPPELEARLMARLQQPIGASERAASLDALARALPSDPSVSRWMERARHSDETMLRVVALGWRVHSGFHEREDKEALLTLLDGWTHVEHPWSDAPAEIVQAGWPNDQEIRDQALETVGAGPTRPIEISAASWLLLSGYHGDSKVRDWILRELDSEHPFVLVDDVVAYELLGRRIGVEPEVGEAIDRRISRLGSPFMPALYAASLATKSETGRKRLLKLLESEDSGALGWVVRALREGWSEDAEVQEALQKLAQRSQAGWVTDQLTDVVSPAELDGWLLERLRDEENGRPSRALQALAERGPEVREKALDEGLKRLGGLNRRADEQVLETLISHYSDLPRGEKLALSHLDDGGVPLSVLVQAARSQPSLHKPVFDRLVPLPQALRRRLAERLGRGAGTSEGARQTVAGWRAEVSSAVASAAASADARRSSEQDKKGLIDTAIESLHSLRLPPQHDSYPGLAALIEYHAIDRFATERARWGDRDLLKLDLHAHYEPDWSLASLLAAHWGEIEASLGEPGERLTRIDSHGAWELIAPFAAAHPQARQACLQYVREHGTGGRPNLIAFLADARPRSKELLSALVDAVDGTISDRSPMRDSMLLGSELMAKHFGGADNPPPALLARIDDYPSPGVLLCLALGWRRSNAAHEAIERHNSRPRPIPIDIEWRLSIALSSATDAEEAIAQYIEYASGQGRFVPPLPEILGRRLAADDEFAHLMSAVVSEEGCSPGKLASYSRLLSSSGRLDRDIRDLLEQRCERALEDEDTDIVAFDLVARENRPLGLALNDALGGV